MKYTIFVEKADELKLIDLTAVSHVIISPLGLSRFGKTSAEESYVIIQAARDLKLSVIIEFDMYCHESLREGLFYSFKKFYLEALKYSPKELLVKVCDLGVALFCAQELPKINLHLNLETSFHNPHSIMSLANHPIIGPALKRVSLSPELPFMEVKSIARSLHLFNIKTDLLLFGRLLLFSTPRELLTPHFEEILKIKEDLMIEGGSEESPHKGFPILQNKQGTFMFNSKDLCLLDIPEKLREVGLDSWVIDLRFEEAEKRVRLTNQALSLTDIFGQEKFLELKNTYERPVNRGFFLTNKSDILLPKLKNNRLQNRHQLMIGQIVDVCKEQGRMAILLRDPEQKIKAPAKLKLSSPTGKEKDMVVHYFEDAEKKQLTESSGHNLLFIPWMSGMTTRSNVFLDL